jgi:hypothetical protein
MKRCSNPYCESSFLFGDDKTNCPFCHAPLINSNEATIPPRHITPLDAAIMEEGHEAEPEFLKYHLHSMECTGRIVEIDHQTLFYSKWHKVMNALFRGEPYQLAHQTIEYTIRVEPITEELPSEVTTDFCLYGNYLGRLQVGDEVRIKAKNRADHRVVESLRNLTTDSMIRPGLQISAAIFRGIFLVELLLLAACVVGVIWFVRSGVAEALLATVMPTAVCLGILYYALKPGKGGWRNR